MRTPLHLAAAAFAIVAATGSGTAAAAVIPTSPPDCPPSSAELSSGAFGAKLLTAASEDGARNALVSPLGIGDVLEAVALGAKLPVRRAVRKMFEVGGASPGQTVDGMDGTSSTEGDTAAVGSDGAEPAGDSGAAGSSAAGTDSGGSPVGDLDGGEQIGWLSCQLASVIHDPDFFDRMVKTDDGFILREGEVSVAVASGAFADLRLDLFPAFSEAFQDRFNDYPSRPIPKIERLDFKDERSVDRINAWVWEATGGDIPYLIPKLDPDDVLVLANATRFQGKWTQPFDPERTVPAPFHLRSGAAPEVPTMHADDLPVRYREDEDFQAAALPYGDGRFEFVAVLPRAGLEAPEALRRLAADPSWLDGQDFRRARGALALPRLDLQAEASLLPALRTLGLGDALDDPQAFAGIAAPAPKLSRVLHRTMLVLDERGTEAAAATAAVMTTRAAIVKEERTFEMRVDRPFALAVRHRDTGAVLFTAWVDDPGTGER